MKAALLLCGILLAASVSPGGAQAGGGTFVPDKNPVAARLAAGVFAAVKSLRGVDADVLAAFRAKEPDPMADRGERYNPTDVVDEHLPMTRFVLAGRSSGMWFVLFEQGGRGYRQRLLVLTREGDGPWRCLEAAQGVVREPVTLEAFQAALKAGEFTAE